jgi:hypothetical protein
LKRFTLSALFVGLFALGMTGCDFTHSQTADQAQAGQQEQLMADAVSRTGVPAIKNFRERKMLKDILELRDQQGLCTWTYVQNITTGRFRLLGESIGYGIPYSTQYTSPSRPAHSYETHEQGNVVVPQADPNGLFSPAAAEGTWVLLKDPTGGKVLPIYVEQRILVTPFRLPARLVED